MKYCFTLFAALLSLAALAQTPKQFSYQAVVRNNRNGINTLAANQQVNLRVSILRGSPTGTAAYVEDHIPTTNANGLFTVQIGGGTRLSGQFVSIKWSTGAFYLKTETDPDPTNGTTSDVVVSTSQLLSVPYALYSQKADSAQYAHKADSVNYALKADSTAYALAVKGHQIGDLFGGGIIFSLWRDNSGQQHGLIASLQDLGSRAWATSDVVVSTNTYNGAINTAAIVSVAGTNNAAGLCDAYVSGSFTDWYLPAAAELNQLYAQIYVIKEVLDADNDPLSTGLNGVIYWSSSYSIGVNSLGHRTAFMQPFNSTFPASAPGVTTAILQRESATIRAIRRF